MTHLYTMKSIFGLVTLAISASAIELTPDTWDAQTSGKTVFVKFFAPWCGHCKRMKPDWDKLMAEYADSETVLVADVDCIGAGKPLCDNVGVQGFPTVKFGNPDSLEDYKGSRELGALQTFAADLKPPCNPDSLEHCDEAQKVEVERLKALSEDDIASAIQRVEDSSVENEAAFKSKVGELQKQYETFKKDFEAAQTALNQEIDMGLYKAVLAHKRQKKEEL